MLNGDVKKQINTARDVLVGKIPDPKGQIEQITNALIYKFMDDQDRLAQTLPGGKASFFIKGLDKYAWHKLFDSKLSNQDKANLYIEGIEQLSEAKHLPDLFKDVFKDAFLPFRDANTIAMFLNEINKFDYHHSENLGNAFEYLLSIMGSQGDAGQFRTPRNIIEFIVDAVDPTKKDTVLDPACGTAGFLVEAYKHITTGSKLSPNEVQELARHINGVDIDPGMAKIARVNLYLHGFKTPLITEDDTLTNESLWGKKYDVILANPPFMTPKGGISPHDKFNVKSSKAEVLFTDYIADHLKLEGRAGIVVPEGIIFQSGGAYKQLRQKLVDDGYLWAVISLPSGVFSPYSGVKTSILLLDRKRAKENEEVLFIKVEDTGFDLGATKREIDRNDIPQALEVISKWRDGEKIDFSKSWFVSKEDIKKSGDYNLSGDRYKVIEESQGDYELIKLGSLITEKTDRVKTAKDIEVWSVSNKEGFVLSSDYFDKQVASANISNYKIIKPGYFAYNPSRINVGSLAFNNTKNTGAVSPMYVVFSINDNSNLLPEYLFSLLKSEKMNEFIINLSQGSVRQQLKFKDLKSISIPLPSLETQKQIVEELNGYSTIISGAKQIVDNWKPKIDIDPDWEKVTLPDISKNEDGKRKPVTKSDRQSGEFPYYGASGVVDYVKNYIFDGEYLLISEDGANLLARSTPIAFSISGKSWVNNHAHVLKFENRYTQKFVEYYLNQINLSEYITGSAQPKLNQGSLNKILVPLPKVEIQKKIVERNEQERLLIESTEKLIEINEEKVKGVIDKLWQ